MWNGGSHPTWSPEGTRIAFVRIRDGWSDEIFVMDADGGNVQQLTEMLERPGCSVARGCRYLAFGPPRSPAWSPGSRIAFAHAQAATYDIYVMDADRGKVRQLTNSSGVTMYPAWSPDGSRIAFERWDSGVNIYVMDADGLNVQKLTEGRSPAW